MDVHAEFLAAVTCPVCMTPTYENAQQCTNGHLVCRSCYLMIQDQRCPTCRCDMANAGRLLLVGQMARSLRIQYPCPHCAESIECTNLESHTNTCPHRPTMCRFLCGHNCLPSQMRAHFREVHHVPEVAAVDGVYPIDTQVQNCILAHEQFPASVLLAGEGGLVRVIVHVLGDDSLVDRFTYRLSGSNGPVSFEWLGRPLSLRGGATQSCCLLDPQHWARVQLELVEADPLQ